jgi:hypothetical protein
MATKTQIYELTPRNGRASFYGKARVIVKGDMHYLLSYDTIMGAINQRTGAIHRYSGYHSNTTGAHVRSFFPDSKAFWKLPIEKKPRVTVTF